MKEQPWLYPLLKDLFLKRVASMRGPHRLTQKGLLDLYYQNPWHRDAMHPPPNTVMLEESWRQLVNELCPVQMIVPRDFSVAERAAEVDDNTNYVYALCRLLDDQHILRLSDHRIAVLLKLSE